jgi:CRP/FNR family cyclic AMP-dependent transcriptional regulator
MDRKFWLLKACPLFDQLAPAQVDELERNARCRDFNRRELIYAPDEPSLNVLLLLRGRVKIKNITPDGKETILAFIEEGEIFGELALLDDELRQEFAEAVEISRVAVIPRDNLLGLMGQRPDLALSITKLVGLRRRRVENRLRNVLFLSSRERMVRLIFELVESHGARVGANEAEIRLRLSHQELASLIGVTRETVTVVLGELQGARLIRVRHRRIGVTDWQRLTEEKDGPALDRLRSVGSQL